MSRDSAIITFAISTRFIASVHMQKRHLWKRLKFSSHQHIEKTCSSHSLSYIINLTDSVIWLLARVYLGCSFQCHDKYENQLMYNQINNDENISSRQSNGSLWLWNCNLRDCQRKYSKRSYTLVIRDPGGRRGKNHTFYGDVPLKDWLIDWMGFNATFSSISAISWRSDWLKTGPN